jgi:diacylglycerol kinase (ATP)
MTQPAFTATLLVNPEARRVRKRFDAHGALRYIRKQGIDCRLEVPDSEETLAKAAAQSAERGDDLLFVAGGDGTLRLAARAIARSETALAALPGGTANVWCKEAGIPGGFRTAVDSHIGGRAVRMDLGDADGEPFMLMAGIGWDAAITRSVSGPLKRATGPVAYGLRGLRMLPSLKTSAMVWSDDDGRHVADCGLIVVSNTRLYGGLVRFSPDALADDGLLDLCALTPIGAGQGALLMARLARGSLSGAPLALTYRTSTVQIETPGLPMQLDGDAVGETPVTISLQQGALKVRVPAGGLPAIFAAG